MLASAIGHELAHVKRRDYALNLAYELLSLPLSFHPATRLMKRRIGATREGACDEMVTARLVKAPAYARSLVRLAASALESVPDRPGCALGMFDPDGLEERVARLVATAPRLGGRAGRSVLAAATFMLALVCGGAASRSLSVTSGENGRSAADVGEFAGRWQAT